MLEKQWPYHTVQSVLTSSLLGLLIASENVTDPGQDSLQLFSDDISNQSVNCFKLFVENLLLKLHNKIFRYYIQIVLGYVLSKFVQMVTPPTLLAK